MTPENRLAGMGLMLPQPAAAVASYVPVVRVGDMLHVSGQLPFLPDGSLLKGLLGKDLSLEDGAKAAQACALMLLAQAAAALGGLDAIARVIKLNVFVASAENFIQQPQVANGASDLMEAVFGEAGRHARSAVGVAQLPLGVAVEIDAIFAVKEVAHGQ